MSSDAFEDRRKALEDQFFKQQNDAALQKLKDQQARAATREEITRLTGITNPTVLDALANLKLGGVREVHGVLRQKRRCASSESLRALVTLNNGTGSVRPFTRTGGRSSSGP